MSRNRNDAGEKREEHRLQGVTHKASIGSCAAAECRWYFMGGVCSGSVLWDGSENETRDGTWYPGAGVSIVHDLWTYMG